MQKRIYGIRSAANTVFTVYGMRLKWYLQYTRSAANTVFTVFGMRQIRYCDVRNSRGVNLLGFVLNIYR